MNKLLDCLKPVLAAFAAVVGVGLLIAWWLRPAPSRPPPPVRTGVGPEVAGLAMLKSLAAFLGSADERQFQRDVSELLSDCQEDMSPSEAEQFKLARRGDVDLLDFSVGRKVCAALGTGFSMDAACMSWAMSKDQRLDFLRKEVVTALRTSEDVQRTKETLRRISNLLFSMNLRPRSAQLTDVYYENAILSAFTDLGTATRDQGCAQRRDAISGLPIFSAKDGDLLYLTKEALFRVSLVTPEEKLPAFTRDVRTPALPKLSDSALDSIIAFIRKERDVIISQLEHDGKSNLIGQVKDDYREFEELFRILAGKPSSDRDVPEQMPAREKTAVPGASVTGSCRLNDMGAPISPAVVLAENPRSKLRNAR
jgi:hypothetical protein